MTKRERDQVVVLLRCAVDLAVTKSWGVFGPAKQAASDTGADRRTAFLATEACIHVAGGKTTGKNLRKFVRVVLEAAQRVEEGAWPG